MIYLDPGHGGRDPGASGGGVNEKDIALNIAARLDQIIPQETILDRTYDETRPLEARILRANREEADIYLSIHCNAFPTSRPGGTEVWHYPGSEGGQRLAEIMAEDFDDYTPLNDRGAKPADNKRDRDVTPYIRVLAGTTMTAVLAELGFLSNKRDREYLTSGEGQRTTAQSITESLARFYDEGC